MSILNDQMVVASQLATAPAFQVVASQVIAIEVDASQAVPGGSPTGMNWNVFDADDWNFFSEDNWDAFGKTRATSFQVVASQSVSYEL